jgi:F0F1-type ATP synthase assembly protein I
MSASILAANRRQALQVLLWQALSVLGLAAVSLALWGVKSGVSVLVGGGVGVVSTAYMAFALLRAGPDASATRIVIGFFVGWVTKVLLTIALLWIVLRSNAFAPLAVIAGFALTFGAFWLAALRRRI